MQLSELLVDQWVALPLESNDLAGVLGELLRRVAAAGVVGESRAAEMAVALAEGSEGETIRLNEDILVVLASLSGLEDLAVTLGVSPVPFHVTGEAGTEWGGARAVILALTPGRVPSLRQELIPALGRVFRDPQRTEHLLAAQRVEEILGFRALMETRLGPRLVVADALVPLSYRVYPDTPLDEVVDLMVRRGTHAVPVVGPGYEVVGILTSGDALEYLVGLRGREGGRDPRPAWPPVAKEFMTRTVLCVSEEQSLGEAANMMVNRDVEQLPVVRDGELVGFVTRDSVLRALRGASDADGSNHDERKGEVDE